MADTSQNGLLPEPLALPQGRARRERRRHAMRQLLPVALLSFLGAMAVFATAYFLERDNADARFRELAEQRLVAVRGSLALVVDITNVVASHFAVLPPSAVSANGFRALVSSALGRHSYIQAFSWNPVLAPGELAEFEQRMVASGLSGFRVTRRTAEGQSEPVTGSEWHVPILFIEPRRGNESAIGFDLASNPTRLRALDAARETGRASATGRIRLVQDRGDQFGILIVSAAKKSGAADPPSATDLIGYVSGVIRVSDLIEADFEGGAVWGGGRVQLHVFDISAPPEEQRLYPALGGQSLDQLLRGLYAAQEFDMAGRKWRLVAVPGPAFKVENLPLISLGVLVVALLCCAFLVMHMRARVAAAEMAEEQAYAIDQARKRLSFAQTLARIGSLDVDRQRMVATPGEGILPILGIREAGTDLPLEVIFRHVPPADRRRVMDAIADRRGAPVEIEFPVMRGGHTFTVLARSDLQEDGEATGITLIFQDVTLIRAAEAERAEMIRRMAEPGRLEALGTLAGGIAHEINTPIQYIGDNLRFIRDAIGDLLSLARAEAAGNRTEVEARLKAVDLDFLEAELPAAADQGLDGVGRIARIVQSVKSFSHPGSEGAVRFDLNETIQSAITVSRNSWKYVAEVEADLDPGLTPVMGSQNEIGQVLLNLILNAAHAIEDAKPAGGGRINVASRVAGDKVIITVADNGKGVPKGMEERIFDLFFTTKGPGRGTGQGLAISRSIIVKNHGGSIAVSPTQGGGATFTVLLPIDGKPLT